MEISGFAIAKKNNMATHDILQWDLALAEKYPVPVLVPLHGSYQDTGLIAVLPPVMDFLGDNNPIPFSQTTPEMPDDLVAVVYLDQKAVSCFEPSCSANEIIPMSFEFTNAGLMRKCRSELPLDTGYEFVVSDDINISATAVQVVPEPACLSLLLLYVPVILHRCRRRTVPPGAK